MKNRINLVFEGNLIQKLIVGSNIRTCINAALKAEKITVPCEINVLVTDDNGLFTEKSFSRYIPELEQPIKGNFFICGLGEEDFAELPQDLIQKFRERFWVPEAFVSMFGQMAVIQMDDGTKPE